MVVIILARTETTTIARNPAENRLEVHYSFDNKLGLDSNFYYWLVTKDIRERVAPEFCYNCPAVEILLKEPIYFIDDPYYCGLRAHIPNFVKKKKEKPEATSSTQQKPPVPHPNQQAIRGHPQGKNHPQMTSHPFWWHSRLYNSDKSGHLSKNKTEICLFSHYPRVT
jgi:hypothetical protein